MSIRIATPDDAPAIAAIYAPYVRDTVISFEAEPPPADTIRQRIEATLTAYPYIVAEDDGEILGYAYAGRFNARQAYDWSAEISVYLRADTQGRGLGRALYAALLALLRMQGLHAIFAGIALPNPASLALHKAIGMSEIGVYPESGFKFGAWHSVAWWGMTISSSQPPSGPPLWFPELLAATPDLSERIARGEVG